jgi:hypothetical protein
MSSNLKPRKSWLAGRCVGDGRLGQENRSFYDACKKLGIIGKLRFWFGESGAQKKSN